MRDYSGVTERGKFLYSLYTIPIPFSYVRYDSGLVSIVQFTIWFHEIVS
jgi:hypothetical protein